MYRAPPGVPPCTEAEVVLFASFLVVTFATRQDEVWRLVRRIHRRSFFSFSFFSFFSCSFLFLRSWETRGRFSVRRRGGGAGERERGEEKKTGGEERKEVGVRTARARDADGAAGGGDGRHLNPIR